MGTYLYRAENQQITALPLTFTHGLGVAPAGDEGCVILTMRTSTGVVYVNASNSQIVVLQSTLANAAVDILVMRFHSIIK